MRAIISLDRHKAAVAALLCLSFVLSPLPRAAAAIKTEAQYKSEASRYEAALRSVSAIADSKLETADDLTRAVAIIERARPDLRLLLSKVVAASLADSTFTAGVKRRASDKQSAEALVKELSSDRNAVLKLAGAEQLKTRLLASIQKDSAALRRSGERLKEAAERIRKSSERGAAGDHSGAGGFAFAKAGFTKATPAETVTAAEPPAPQDPATIAFVVLGVIFAVDVVLIAAAVIKNASTEEGRDATAECLERVDRRLAQCRAEARRAFIPALAEAACYADWLIASGACFVNPDR
jgi:hypothetical protein